MKKGFTYILECYDGSYYTGSTVDLKRRLTEHSRGYGSEYTSTRLPIKLVYFEKYEQIEDAFKREKQIQKWSRKKKEALILGWKALLPLYAKKKFKNY